MGSFDKPTYARQSQHLSSSLQEEPGKPKIKFECDKDLIKGAIRAVPKNDWATYFEELRYEQYKQLPQAVSEQQRLEIQSAVKALNLIQYKFDELRIENKP
jgi:Mg/Co/Ni transporter MgtE